MDKITVFKPQQCGAIQARHVILTVTAAGKIISIFRHVCRTVNRNFWNAVLMSQSGAPGVATNFGAGYISLKQISGAVGAINADTAAINLTGPVGNASRGIVVGSGTGAENFEGYALSTLITHGTGAGQMSYAVNAASAQSYNAGLLKWTITITRSFTNTSGNPIDVKEIAMYGYVATNYVMLWRDLLGATVTVPNNAVLTVAYEITLTLPA